MAQPGRQAMAPNLGGLVIAGGRSRRFGTEKAVAMFRGRTLLDWSLAALSETRGSVAVNAAPASHAARLAAAGGHPVLLDDPAHPAGPLAGLAAGLIWARDLGFDYLATLPCDTPLLRAAHIRALGTPPEGAGAIFATTVHGPQPLCAVWRTSMSGRLAARLTAGRHPSIRAFLAEIDSAAVFFADPGRFADADTPQALAALDRPRAGPPA